MSFINGLPVNFNISTSAKNAIECARRDCPSPPDIVAVAWSYRWPREDGDDGAPAIGFYPSSARPDLEHALEMVDGLELLFFVTARDHQRFDGMLLDADPDGAFFVRPRPS